MAQSPNIGGFLNDTVVVPTQTIVRATSQGVAALGEGVGKVWEGTMSGVTSGFANLVPKSPNSEGPSAGLTISAASSPTFDPAANRANRFESAASPTSPAPGGYKHGAGEDEESQDFDDFNFWGPPKYSPPPPA